MKLSNQGSVPVYTIAGAVTSRPLPEWLARKRKRSLKQDSDFANRIELLQDFEFEEASSCVRVSEDGDWAMSTGTYKPQIHTHYLPHLALSYARHTNCLNETFVLLSSDYSKSLHLQTDRFLEFHNPGGLHYSTRIPRYGRDLIYNRRSAEALIPAVGLDADGLGEVFRLNLELGRFMKGYQIQLEHDGLDTDLLDGILRDEAVNTAAVAEHSHDMLAFGTSMGTVEFWDSRSRSRVGLLDPLRRPQDATTDSREEITALEFRRSGLQIAAGTSAGRINIYDLRSPIPLLRKEQGYDYPIKNIQYLESDTSSDKIMSADKRIIKIWDAVSGDAWTSVEPAVDLNHVEWVPKSGMFLTANEGRQQHSFLIPQLGPAPKWCAFLDNLVEEMAEDADDPSAYSANASSSVGAVYDNFKFLSTAQLRELNMDHLIGQTSLLRPYMHGYFVAQKLYEQARLISNPDLFTQQRDKSIQERIAKERESRVRGTKSVKVKVNRKLAEKMQAKEEANEARKARRLLKQSGNAVQSPPPDSPALDQSKPEDSTLDEPALPSGRGVLSDSRFSRLFQDTDYEIDETSREFALQNPSTVIDPTPRTSDKKHNLTAVEQEDVDKANDNHSSSDESGSEDEEEIAARQRQRSRKGQDGSGDKTRVSSAAYRKAGHRSQRDEPSMVVSSADKNRVRKNVANKTFGRMAARLPNGDHSGRRAVDKARSGVGEKSVTFAPMQSTGYGKGRRNEREETSAAGGGRGKMDHGKDRRSASGNAFRRM